MLCGIQPDSRSCPLVLEFASISCSTFSLSLELIAQQRMIPLLALLSLLVMLLLLMSVLLSLLKRCYRR